MNCYDCGKLGQYRAAVACCAECGAAVCVEHAVRTSRYLTRTAPINRVEIVDPPARSIRCEVCAAAREAQERPTVTRDRQVRRDLSWAG